MMQHRMAQDTPSRLYSLEEASKILGIGIRTLRSQVAAGKLKVVHVSPRRRAIHPDDLDRYVRENRK